MQDSKYGKVTLELKPDAPADEPCFVLRGQDRLAANTVRAYGDKYLEATGDTKGFEQIMLHARRMEVWKAKKLPD